MLGQSHGNVELIVVDDGSTDGSPGDPRRTGCRTPRPHCACCTPSASAPIRHATWALKQARGEFVAFLDADDWWLPDTLEKLHTALVGNTVPTSPTAAGRTWAKASSRHPHVPPAYEDDDPVAHFVRTCPWPIHAALVRRSVVDRLGGFSERRFASMDYDFWLRALALTRTHRARARGAGLLPLARLGPDLGGQVAPGAGRARGAAGTSSAPTPAWSPTCPQRRCRT